MEKDTPKILYKYRAVNKRTIDMLKYNQVYFASPLDFNDPFDCFAQESMHSNFRKDVARHLASSALKIPQKSVFENQILVFKEIINQDPVMLQSENYMEDLLSEYREKVGILSLSSRNDSILMWSHYADSHKGFCIGFKNNLDVRPSDIKEVMYSETINKSYIYDFFKNNNLTEESFNKTFQKELFLTKFIDWKYEKEWRIIGYPPRNIVTYSEECLDSIIFGLKMEQNEMDQIKEVLKNKNIKFFKVIKSNDEFKIEMMRLED